MIWPGVLAPYATLIKWGAIALVVLGLVGFGAYQMHKRDVKKYDTLELEYKTFKVDVAALGKQAQKAAEDKEALDKEKKEKADASQKKLGADLAIANKLLRDTRARSGYLPTASPTTGSPTRITFDRAELERAIQQFDAGVQGLVEQGDTFRLKLDTAIRWAQPN